jgi:hypothetical protein
MGMSEKRAAPKKKASKPVPQKRDRLIGYMVLGCGAAAMFAVAALAVQRYAPRQMGGSTEAGSTAAGDDGIVMTQAISPATTAAAQGAVSGVRTYQKPIERQNVFKEGRARRVSDEQIAGVWESKFLDYYSLFHIKDGTYQIITMRSVTGKPRYYARGRYAVQGAYLTLTPDKSMGTPQDDDLSRRYLPLATRPFTVELRIEDGTQLWFAGPLDPQFPNSSAVYPLIQYSGEEGIRWTRKAE